jgi:hypothetical protein
MGNNGKTMLRPVAKMGDDTPAAQPQKSGTERIILGLLPFTPVPLTGPDFLLAWGRLAGYSLLAYWTFNKTRPISYAFMGAAGVSLATSLTAGMWNKNV